LPALKTPDVNKQSLKKKTIIFKTNTDHHNGDLNVCFLFFLYVLLILNVNF